MNVYTVEPNENNAKRQNYLQQIVSKLQNISIVDEHLPNFFRHRFWKTQKTIMQTREP